jgi:hypothetical protein
MNEEALKLFHALMHKGYITREEDITLFSSLDEEEVSDALEKMGEELRFEIYRTRDRIYLVPKQDNDLFLKNNTDYRRDIQAGNDIHAADLYLMNYLAVFILNIFYHGEKDEIKVTDFLTMESIIHDFNDHCTSVTKDNTEETAADDYSENFHKLAETWLAKKEGKKDSRKAEDKYGILNRLIQKFTVEDLMYVDASGHLRTTRKLDDLMPFVLRKERSAAMNAWLNERRA